jgi:hypothetical protein
VIEEGVTGCMDNDLAVAVKKALDLPRDAVYSGSMNWSWDNAWNIFKNTLIPVQ